MLKEMCLVVLQHRQNVWKGKMICVFFFPKESHNEYNLNIKAVLRFAQLSLEEKAKSSRMTLLGFSTLQTLTLFNIK